MATSLDSVCQQMMSAGLPDIYPNELQLDSAGWVRYGKGRKKAFYKVASFRTQDGQMLVSYGTYGIGGDGPYKIEPDESLSKRLSPEEWAAIAQERVARQKEEARQLAKQQHLAANRAKDQWSKASVQGESAYLLRKQVAKAEGVRFMVESGWVGWIILQLHRYDRMDSVVGSQKIAPSKLPGGEDKRFNKGMNKDGAALCLGDLPSDGDLILVGEGYATCASAREALAYQTSVFMACDAGNLLPVARILRTKYPTSPVLFIADDDYLPKKNGQENHTGKIKATAAAGEIGNAAVVLPSFKVSRRLSREDELLPHLTDFNDLHLAEGLDTVGAQLRAAIGREHFEQTKFPLSPTPTTEEAVLVGEQSAAGGGVDWPDRLFRHFALISGKTRFWDHLSKTEYTSAALAAMVGDKKIVADWLARPDKRTMLAEDVAALKQAKADPSNNTIFVEMLTRYVYLDGSANVWDGMLRKMIANNALKMALGDWYDTWLNHPNRRVIPFDNLVFDPSQRVCTESHINLFRGLPLVPKSSARHARYVDAMAAWADYPECDGILSLVAWLCNHRIDVMNWFFCWLAYPLQNVGGKLETAVLMHGDVHGSGKSLFFEGVLKPMYGEYATTLGQHQLDSQYTSWRSKRLFCLFEEVFASNQKYSHTGTLKHMVSGKTQAIEKKFVDSWEEDNHMNCAFLSNAVQPFHIEPSDRRFLVIWPREKLSEELQKQVEHELANGGVEAFYAFLLAHPLTCNKVSEAGEIVDQQGNPVHDEAGKVVGSPAVLAFTPHTKPLMTPEKARLINYGLSGWELFLRDWQAGVVGGDRLDDRIPFASCLSRELYAVYRHWCIRENEREISANKFSSALSAKIPKATRWYVLPGSRERFQSTIFRIGKPPPKEPDEVWMGKDIMNFRVKARAWGVKLGDDE